MSSYYVDFENVGSLGMDGLSLLTSKDTVYIFYSNKADTMKMDVVARIYNTSAQIVFEKVELGTPNALDFQLLTDLFCKIRNEQEKTYIISKDTGYDVAVKRGRNMYHFELWRKTSIRKAVEVSKHQGTDAVKTFEASDAGCEKVPSVTEEETAFEAAQESENRSLGIDENVNASQESEAQNIEASEEKPAIEAEVVQRPKRFKSRSHSRKLQRRKDNQDAENSVPETAAESKALIPGQVPLQLIVFDQKPVEKYQKRFGSKRSDNRKNHEKPVMTSLSGEIRVLLKSQCDMDITDEECRIVIKAAGSSNKGEFYHCFRREMGDANGREFYLKIRGCFDGIRKLTKKYE